jgi:hypothetical protein
MGTCDVAESFPRCQRNAMRHSCGCQAIFCTTALLLLYSCITVKITTQHQTRVPYCTLLLASLVYQLPATQRNSTRYNTGISGRPAATPNIDRPRS